MGAMTIGPEDACILIVDDSDANVRLLTRLLGSWGYTRVTSTTDSREAVPLCTRLRPDLIMLDLHMPHPDGFEVMRMLSPWIGGENYLPVLALSGDLTREVRQRALRMGARDFIAKPYDADEVRLRIANLLQTRRLHLQLVDRTEMLDRKVDERTHELELAREEVFERLALAAEYRDDDTHEHALRVGRTAGLLALQLGLPERQAGLLERAAPLHDIGKIGVSDLILLKPGKLTAQEYERMKEHTQIGAEILSNSRSQVLRLGAEIALTHHERWDGGGYPAGLTADQIPLSGRLVALADVFDALTHDRPYKQAWPLEAALDEIRASSGTHFDPNVVAAFEGLDLESLNTPMGPSSLRVPNSATSI